MLRKPSTAVLIPLLLIAFQCSCLAQESGISPSELKERTNKSLSVVEDVSVIVSFPEAKKVGMSTTNIKTNTELQLRKAGISVASDGGETNNYTGVLIVQIGSISSETLITYYISCRLLHPANPLGTDVTIPVPIYKTKASIGNTRLEGAEETINKVVSQKTRTFMNRWLAAHN